MRMMTMRSDEEYWQNPFEKSLVEDWRLEEFPENYREIASCSFFLLNL